MAKKPTYSELVQRIKRLEQEAEKLRREKGPSDVSSRYLQAILDNTNLPIFLKDADLNYILINCQFEKLAQVTNDYIRGKSDFDVFPEPVALLFRSQDEEVIRRNAMTEFTETISLPDGIHTFITSKFPLFDAEGTICAVGGVCTDITELREMQETLKETAEKYENLFQYSSDGIFLHDMKGNIIDANRKVLEQTCYTKDEFLGLTVIDLHPEDMAAKARHASQEVARLGFVHFETYLKKKDGRLFPAEVSMSLLDISEQEVVQVIVRDTSDRKRLEAELLKVQKLESTGILAGGIAHDFNNLLTAIMGNISIAKMYVNDDNVLSKLISAETASSRAQGLTQQLLTFSKGGAPVKKSISIAEVLKNSASFILSGSNVACDLSIHETLWPVMADEGQIGQAIQNIVKNADESMPEGGTINILAENVTIGAKDALPLQDGRYVRITVQDHGVGIPEEHIARVFDPYFSAKKEGSGLGLATAYSILKSHDGLINVESRFGAGSSFFIHLPVADQTPGTRTKSGDLIHGRGEKILLMDDEPSVLQVASDMLCSMGYRVEVAHNGTEAIARYISASESGSPFDAVILDLTIVGGMGGLEAVRRLRELNPDLKTIVSSGYANDPVMANYSSHGFSDVVTKPYGAGKLSEVLSKLFG